MSAWRTYKSIELFVELYNNVNVVRGVGFEPTQAYANGS